MGGTFTWGTSAPTQVKDKPRPRKETKKATKPPPEKKASNKTIEAENFKKSQKDLKKVIAKYRSNPEMTKEDPELQASLSNYYKTHEAYFSSKLEPGAEYKPPEMQALPPKKGEKPQSEELTAEQKQAESEFNAYQQQRNEVVRQDANASKEQTPPLSEADAETAINKQLKESNDSEPRTNRGGKRVTKKRGTTNQES
jgi:hypothetical protein